MTGPPMDSSFLSGPQGAPRRAPSPFLSTPQQQRPSFPTSHPPAPQPHPAMAGGPQTFAQLSAAGQARPNPAPPSMSASGAPPSAPPIGGFTNANTGAQDTGMMDAGGPYAGMSVADYLKAINTPGSPQFKAFSPPGYEFHNGAWSNPNAQPPYTGAFPGGSGGAAGLRGVGNLPITIGDPAPTGPTGDPASGGAAAGASGSTTIPDEFQQQLRAALASGGSRYGLPDVQKVRDALTAQLEAQFAGQQKGLDEEMARRGIGSSSIAAGYNGDLRGQQDRALSGMNASLIQDAAANHANDLSASLGLGQNYLNSLAQQGQFGQSLAQQMQLALMGDKTANRGIDANAALANNALWAQLAQILGLSGVGSLSKSTAGTDTADGPATDDPTKPPPKVPKGAKK